MDVCPGCGNDKLTQVLRLDDVPGLCNAFWPSEASARGAPRGVIRLLACPDCGLIHNAAFDEKAALYSPAYDNSIHFSPSFQRYIDELAERLVERYDLHGKDIVEIGCGSGDFLTALCDKGHNRGIGYDPSYDPARARGSRQDDIDIRAERYPAAGLAGQFVACRHVLEHLPDPVGLLTALRSSLGNRADVVVYFEVPDATYMLEELAVWDIIHEHRSYFSAPTLQWLFEAAGFETLETGRSLGDQYLYIEARPAPGRPRPPFPDLHIQTKLVAGLEDSYSSAVSTWQDRVAAGDANRMVVWGAGSKGVMFLNRVDPDGRIGQVVDINPHKQGRHVPVTGQRITGPDALIAGASAQVVVMNPQFRDEIERSLRDRGLMAEVVAV